MYYARAQRRLLGLVLFFPLVLITVEDFSKWLQLVQIFVAFFIFIALLVEFKFEIDERFLTYQILFFHLPIYKKKVHYHDIKSMKFKRIGWAKKCVIIKTEKGFNFRIANFYPRKIYLDLSNFAKENGIPVSKSKDYIILEK